MQTQSNTIGAQAGMRTDFVSYINHGWKLCPIPPREKGPTGDGWNKLGNELQPTTPMPHDWNAGLLHAYSGTAAIDIDDEDEARTWLGLFGVELDSLLGAPDAVEITSGNPNHRKLLYAMPVPLPSKKVISGTNNIIDFRCASSDGGTIQDVLPGSVHPGGTTYAWAGNGNWQQLPPMPEPLLNIWMTLLDKPRPPRNTSNTPVELAELKSALYHLKPDCDRTTWIKLGMGVSAATDGSEEGFRLWDDWSSQCKEKYNEKEMGTQWKSFKNTKPDGVTAATVFHLAIKAGWQRPLPDLSKIFASVETPKEQLPTSVLAHPPVPKIDLRLWPKLLADRAAEVGNEVGCDSVVPLIAGLSAVSAAADKRIKLRITDTWTVPPVLWTMTIGDPADKKTPGSKPMFAPLYQLEREDIPGHSAKKLMYEGQLARYAQYMKELREFETRSMPMPGDVGPTPVEEPKQPQSLRLLISDATTQKVVHMAQDRPRGFLLYLDEMNHWLTKLSDGKGNDDRGCWMQGYESGPYTMDRIGAGSIRADNLAVSIYGNCQPAVFRKHMMASSQDGLVQRFLPVRLDPTQNRIFQDSLPDYLSSKPAYEQLIRSTFALPDWEYRLTPEALQIFRAFSQWCIGLRNDERLLKASDVYMTATGKLEGNCARLALLFHLIQSPFEVELSVATMLQAVQVMKQFFVPQLRYAFIELCGNKDELFEWVTDYIVQNATIKQTITLSELRAAARRQIEGKSHMDATLSLRLIMDELQLAAYVMTVAEVPNNVTWAINPQLAHTFSAHRHAVIAAKQAQLERYKSDGLKAGKVFTPINAIGHRSEIQPI